MLSSDDAVHLHILAATSSYCPLHHPQRKFTGTTRLYTLLKHLRGLNLAFSKTIKY